MDWSTQLKIQRLERGVGCFIGRGRYRYPVTLPVSLSKHKQEGEHLFQTCERYGVPLLTYRPETVLGMSQRMVERVLTLKEMPEIFDASAYLDRNSMPEGTAFRILSEFARQGLLERVEKGRYRIPTETQELIAKVDST